MAESTGQAAVMRGVLHQVFSGYATILLFIRLAIVGTTTGVSVSNQLVHGSLASAALLIGMGVGFPFHSAIGRRHGLKIAARTSLTMLAIGIIVSSLAPTPWGIIVGALLIGLGLLGEWTPSAEITRLSLTSTQRWNGMRLHGMCWFAGALLAVIVGVSTTSSTLTVMSMLITLGTFVLIPSMQTPPHSEQDNEHAVPTDNPTCPPKLPAGFGTAAIENAPRVEADNSRDSCEEENCCGGGSEWTPMPVYLGACLAFCGFFAIGLVLPWLMVSASPASAAVVAAGGLLGVILFQAVVPTTGYAVLLVPVCLLGTVAFGTSPWLGSLWSAAWLICQAAIASALYCGASGLVGESFVDSCQGNSRTVVLLQGTMAAGALSVVTGILTAMTSLPIFALTVAALCVATILWLRQIPSLMVSQRRQDEIPSEEPEKLLSETIGIVGGPPE